MSQYKKKYSIINALIKKGLLEYYFLFSFVYHLPTDTHTTKKYTKIDFNHVFFKILIYIN